MKRPVEQIVQEAAAAWMAGDGESFAALFSADGLFVVPGKHWQGPVAIREAVQEFAETHTDVVIRIGQIVSEGNRTVIEWHWQDKEIATGEKTCADDAIVVDFDADGQIQRWREYIDASTPASAS